jgi:thymidylate synthase (FAD)
MAHCVVPEAEAILDEEYRVLDRGFVRLVDYLGGDERIVQAARVSYGSGTKSYREDSGLIDFLLRNRHTSPFEQVILTFHVKLPVFVARQWIRHRTARVNEISGRYSVMKDEFYSPAPSDIAKQSADNKQGREDEPVAGAIAGEVQKALSENQESAYGTYLGLIERGIARELARIALPLNLYTEWYWQIDLHNLFNFLSLRLDPHAQREIRLYAEKMLEIAAKVCPLACSAFREYVLGSVRFSAKEYLALRDLLDGKPESLTGKALERFRKKISNGTQT